MSKLQAHASPNHTNTRWAQGGWGSIYISIYISLSLSLSFFVLVSVSFSLPLSLSGSVSLSVYNTRTVAPKRQITLECARVSAVAPDS